MWPEFKMWRAMDEKQVMEKQLAFLKTDLEEALTQNKNLRNEINNVYSVLKRLHEIYTELQTRYQATEKLLYQSQVKVAEQNNEIELNFQVVQDLKAVKADLTDQVSEYQKRYSLQNEKLRNPSEFLEAEKQLNLEALTDCRTRLKAEVELAANYKKHTDALQSSCTELQQSNDQLLSNVQMLEETLSLKSMDIDMICTAMDKLKERMESVLSSLQQKGDHKVKPVNSSFPEESSLMTQIPSARKAQPLMSQSSSTSFAQQTGSVLQSFSVYQNFTNSYRVHNAEKTRQEQSNIQFGAHQPRPVAEAENRISPCSQSFHMTSQSSRMLTDSKKSLLFSSASEATYFKLDVRSCLEGDSVLAKVHLVNKLFSLILSTIDKAQRASELTVNDLKEDISLLEDKLKLQCCQSKDLETELVQKSAQLVSVKLQIQERNIQLRENTRSLLTFQDQEHKVAALEEEKADLRRTVRAQKEEVMMLSEQIHEALKRLDNVKTGQKPECACLREIFDLKSRNQNLVMKLFDAKEKNTDAKEAAVQRMKILDGKCRKVETEVNKFDKLVEKIREICTSSHEQSTNPVILQVVRLIDEV